MSLKFLIALLNYIQRELGKTAENHEKIAVKRAEQIGVLERSRRENKDAAAKAEKLSGKIGDLLA